MIVDSIPVVKGGGVGFSRFDLGSRNTQRLKTVCFSSRDMFPDNYPIMLDEGRRLRL